jgi:hypothetical protein
MRLSISGIRTLALPQYDHHEKTSSCNFDVLVIYKKFTSLSPKSNQPIRR